MGRLTDRIAKRQAKRQASLDAMRNTQSDAITKLPSMAERGPTYKKEQKQLYEYGVYDGMEGVFNQSRGRSKDYCEGFEAGERAQRIIETQSGRYGAHGEWREKMANRPVRPSDQQVTAELTARTAADEQRQAERRASGLFDALR